MKNTNEIKISIELDTIENTGSGVKITNLILKIDNHKFNISTTGYQIRVRSSHLITELNILITWLDIQENENKVRDFSKDMIKADKTLKTIFYIK